MRALAQALGVSPATVSLAYRILRERGLIVTGGRRGTHVAPRPPMLAVPAAAPPPPPDVRDLSAGLPDPALLPDVAVALDRVDVTRVLQMREVDRADPTLIELAAAALEAEGIPSGHLTLSSGAFDAIERVLEAHLRPGDRVVVEDPTYGAFRDLLTALGLIALPVVTDDEGPRPDEFEAALATGASAVLLMPRAQNPTGAARSARRAQELSAALARHPAVLVIEDDHAGPISGADVHALSGTERWALVRSTSKHLHPDLRVAVLAGDPLTIARVEGRLALGPRWVSPILQALVVELLRDPGLPAVTAAARDTYARRRTALIDALAAEGLQARGRSGLNVWVPVREEAGTVAALRSSGYAVAAGERFRFTAPAAIRVTTAVLPEDEAGGVARAIANAQRPAGGRAGY